jgi:hypothetical protein
VIANLNQIICKDFSMVGTPIGLRYF